MARLFIVDQSLKSPGGHHFDYTSLLAREALERGCETVVATHRKFKDHRLLPARCEIRGVFRQTTYHRLSHFRRMIDAAAINERDDTGTASSLLKSPTYSGAASAAQHSTGLKRFWLEGRIRKQAARFATDLRSLFRNCHFQSSDQVFFTTLSEIELQGLADFLNSNDSTLRAKWHAQFHFSLYAGRTPEYSLQHSVIAPTANRIRSALDRIDQHQLQLYATSDAIAEQFKLIDVKDIQELTYPVSRELFARRNNRMKSAASQDGPVRVACAGGIREEKGAGKLNELMSLLWPDFLSNQRIQFSLQRRQRSSLRTQQVDLSGFADTLPETVDEDQLDSSIRFVDHPLPADEYIDFIRNTDIGMLLYDSRSYYSRRAGVMGEYLAAGVPVIVPAGCWLSDQLAEPNFAYADRLLAAARQTGKAFSSTPQWQNNAAARLEQIVVGGQPEIHPTCIVGTSGKSSGLVLNFDVVEPAAQGYFLRIDARELDRFGNEIATHSQVTGKRKSGESNSLYFRLNRETWDVELKLSNAYEDSLMLTSQIAVHQLTDLSADAFRRPLGAVGLMADDLRSVPRLLDDMIQNQRHYRETAERFSGEWFDAHDPAGTLRAILNQPALLPASAAA